LLYQYCIAGKKNINLKEHQNETYKIEFKSSLDSLFFVLFS
jgi:hypothetical protein